MSEDNKTKKSKNSGCFIETIIGMFWIFIFTIFILMCINEFSERLANIIGFVLAIYVFASFVYRLLRPLYREIKKYKEIKKKWK